MAKEKNIPDGLSAEEKIKEAAKKMFTRKGYAATRTRDIAEEAGLNLALLNYYFRSKEKLFDIIMMEKVQQLFGVIAPVVNDPSTTLDEKVKRLVSSYIDTLSENEDLPLFVLSEIKYNADRFATKMNVSKLLLDSSLVKQIYEKRPDMNPMHFVINILSMTLFPFVARPILFAAGGVSDKKAFQKLLQERKELIPVWIKTILKAK